MSGDPFFSLPRYVHPREWFETILPALPLRLPAITIPHAITYHVMGPGGGVWSVQLVDGHLQTREGWAERTAVQVAMTVPHLREALTGALRNRFADALRGAGRPLVLPDLTTLPVDAARMQALSSVVGTLAVDVVDRKFSDKYRYVFTFGSHMAAFDTASTTLEIDADDLVQLLLERGSPWQLLKGPRVRIKGDMDRPAEVLRALLGRQGPA